MSADLATLRALKERVEAADGHDLQLARDMAAAVLEGEWKPWTSGRRVRREWLFAPDGKVILADDGRCLNWFRSVDDALALVWRIFPNWWHTSGLCSLTGHASIGPDYNGPNGEELKREFPPERYEDFSADLAPGDGPHRQCYAILSCLLQALISRAEEARQS